MIMKYTQYNYSTVTLESLSEVFHYTPVYLSKLFKRNLNQNFSSVVQNLKLYHTKKYLEMSEYKIEEITQRVGYESPDYLSRIFKKAYTVTPSEYRNQILRQKKSPDLLF